MAKVLTALKENFPDIYNFLIKNQKENNLIFFAPNAQLYDKDSLKEKSFYYSHIFQKSRFDPHLYTNFYGKVLKEIKEKNFITYLGWSLEMTINVIESFYFGDDNDLFVFQTDGICIEEASKAQKIPDKQSIETKECPNSKEYLNYYSKYDKPEFADFQKGINSMKSFIFFIDNNYLLIKGKELDLSLIFKDKMTKFNSAFEILFKKNQNHSKIAREYVDSYIFENLYDKIMKKLDSFYYHEQKDLKLKIEENLEKYSLLKLKLDNCLLKCNFTEIYDSFNILKDIKTCFEKVNCFRQINSIIIKEVKAIYEKEKRKKMEIQGDLLNSLWTYVLTHYFQKNDINDLYLDYLFLKNFYFDKGNEDDYIIKAFVISMEIIQEELLSEEKAIELKPTIEPITIISFV